MKGIQVRLIGGGAAYNLDLGFFPHRVQVSLIDTATNSVFYIWHGKTQQEAALSVTDSVEYGIKISEGVTAICDTTAKGISVYDGSKVPQVLVDSPKPGVGLVKADVADWSASVDYSSAGSARTATAVGTIVRPPIHNGRVFELTMATGTGTSEPSSWDVQPGETVTDGGSNVFTCRQENVVANKARGITLGATLLTDNAHFFVVAERFDQEYDLGDIG